MKFTPGPWKLEFQNGRILVIARGEIVSGCVACIQTDWAHEDQNGEQRANALLIAAAPELLLALKALMTIEPRDGTEYDELAVYRQVAEVISKAQGKV